VVEGLEKGSSAQLTQRRGNGIVLLEEQIALSNLQTRQHGHHSRLNFLHRQRRGGCDELQSLKFSGDLQACLLVSPISARKGQAELLVAKLSVSRSHARLQRLEFAEGLEVQSKSRGLSQDGQIEAMRERGREGCTIVDSSNSEWPSRALWATVSENKAGSSNATDLVEDALVESSLQGLALLRQTRHSGQQSLPLFAVSRH
jgi:hypothetical protein